MRRRPFLSEDALCVLRLALLLGGHARTVREVYGHRDADTITWRLVRAGYLRRGQGGTRSRRGVVNLTAAGLAALHFDERMDIHETAEICWKPEEAHATRK